MIRAVLAAVAAVCVAACGVSLEERPQRLDDTPAQQPARAPHVTTERPTTSSSSTPPTTTMTTTGPPP